MRQALALGLLMLAASNASALDWRAWFGFGLDESEKTAVREAKAFGTAESLRRHPVVDMGDGVYRVTGYGVAPKESASRAQAEIMAVYAAELDAFGKLSALVSGRDIKTVYESAGFQLIRAMIIERTHTFLKGVRILDTRVNPEGTAEVDVELVLDRAERSADFSSAAGYRIRRVVETSSAEEPRVESPSESSVSTLEVEESRSDTKKVTEPPPREDRSDAKSSGRSVTRSSASSAAEDTLFGTLAEIEPALEPLHTNETVTARSVLTRGKVIITPPGESVSVNEGPRRARVLQTKSPSVKVEPPKRDFYWEEDPNDGMYTDLVLDARGTGYEPTDHPRAYLAGGTQIYPIKGGLLDVDTRVPEPEILHAKNMHEAYRIPGFGKRPLIIEDIRVSASHKDGLVMPPSTLLRIIPLFKSRLLHGHGHVVILTD